MPVLYRKHRPQTFEDVVGQEHVTRTLVAAIAAGRVAHAYLFSGPRGVGKTTTARLLAKAVNCLAPRHSEERSDEETRAKHRSKQTLPVPCNACIRCEEITAGRCMDVVEIDAASNTQVEKVREYIIEAVRIAPAVAAKKVYIIDEVHMLSTASFNALLKTLEEPPEHVHFILATTEMQKVPETITSRCQHFTFRRVGDGTLTERLRMLAGVEDVAVDDEVLAQVVRAADGSVRDAESLLGQLMAVGGKRVTADVAALVLPQSNMVHVQTLLRAVGAGDTALALATLDAASAEGCDADAFCRDIINELRSAARAAAQQGAVATAQVFALRMFTELLDRIGRADRPFFLLEVAVLTLLARSPFVPAAPAASASPGKMNPAQLASSQRDASRSNDDDAPPATTGGAARTPQHASRARTPASIKLPTTVTDTSDPVPPPLQEGESEGVRFIPPPSAGRREQLPTSTVIQSATEALSKVQQQWHHIIRDLADVNRSIPYLLEGGRPQRIADGTLTIGFRYKLHAEKVRQPGIIEPLTSAIARIVGTPLHLDPVAIAVEHFEELDRACRPATGDTTVDAALEVFASSRVIAASEPARGTAAAPIME
ncbi:MAG: DNA polymerase III subunit gamma/tau [bacterium]|nr:DNA polymerase III subunit gamma/tau [bacterium]